MKIDLKHNIPGDSFFVEDVLEAKNLTVDDGMVKFLEDAKCAFHVNVTQELVAIYGSVTAVACLSCGRCLGEFEEGIVNDSFEYTVNYTEGMCIDLTDSIREAIIIRLSVKPLCSDDCKGLCATCGSNLNEGRCSCSKNEKKDLNIESEEKKSAFEGLDFTDGKIDFK